MTHYDTLEQTNTNTAANQNSCAYLETVRGRARCAATRNVFESLHAHAHLDANTPPHPFLTHFDTGFPLKLNFSAGKEGEGTERCMSQQNCTVEQCFDRCAVASLCTSQLCEKVESLWEVS